MNQHLPTSKGSRPFETITLSRNLYFRHDGGLFLPAFDRSTGLNFIPDISTLFIPYSLKNLERVTRFKTSSMLSSLYIILRNDKLSGMKFLLFRSNNEI